MTMEIIGKIVTMNYEQGTSQAGNEWAKQTVVIETQDAYPKKVALTVFGQDRIDQFNLKTEEVITFSINLESRPYFDRNNNARWSTEARAYAVKRGNGVQTPPAGLPQQTTKGVPSFPTPAPSASANPVPETDSKLPF